MFRRILSVALVALSAACATKRVNEEPVLENGDRTADQDAIVAGSAAAMAAADGTARRDALAADALSNCAPDVCAAIARGELALGMTVRQVLAATRTTEDAWSMRNSGPATVLTAAYSTQPPEDAVADIAMVQFHDGRVSAYSYLEPTGVRVVDSAADATTQGRALALADQLVREGDDYAARGDLDAALDRYDRADVLNPRDAMIDYRIATVLDKSLRPIEALIRYRLFLHQLELEKIQAYGEAYANLAEAIAYARERIIILDRR
ncbi:MAG: hypothetical protein ACRELV_09280 [Longimicrobiales bacterium]